MLRPSVRNSINYSNKRLTYSRQWGNRKVDIEYNGKKRVSGKMNKPFRHHIIQGGEIILFVRLNAFDHVYIWILEIHFLSFFQKKCHNTNYYTPPKIYKLSFSGALMENVYHILTDCLLAGTLYRFCTALMEYTLNKKLNLWKTKTCRQTIRYKSKH